MGNILIIEDDSLIAKIYTTRLSADGYMVEWCSNGREALEKIITFKPQLILLDVMMPEMNGFDLLKEVRSREEFSKIPILMYSSLSGEAEIAKARALGATEYLNKTLLTPTEVVNTIKKYLPQ